MTEVGRYLKWFVTSGAAIVIIHTVGDGGGGTTAYQFFMQRIIYL